MKFDQESEQPNQDPRRQVTSQDIERIFSIEAVNTNKFYITVQLDGIVRICFADTDPSGKFMCPRYVVSMSMNAFASFAQLIAENMQQLARMQQPQTAVEKAN